MPTTSTYAALREQLVAERDNVLVRAGLLDANAAALAATNASGDTRREAMVEGDSVSVERELISRLSAGVRSKLEDIDLAIARIDAGTYGACTKCTQEIPLQRLEVRPHSATCVPCASR